MKRRLFTWVCGVLLAVSSASTFAAIEPVTAKVKRLLLHNDGSFGNCMVLLTTGPETVLPDCRADWVSFSCDGTHLAKDIAARLLEQAQISFLLDRELKIYVDDTIRHNNFCVAVRVDLF